MTSIDATPLTGADVPRQTQRKVAKTFHRKADVQQVTPMPNVLKSRVEAMAKDLGVSRAAINMLAISDYQSAGAKPLRILKKDETSPLNTENQLVTPMPRDTKDFLQEIATDHGSSRSAVNRTIITNFLTASGY